MLATAAVVLGTTRVSRAEPGHHPLNLSFFYPISTNQDAMVLTNFRLNLLYGRVGALRGVDISGVAGRIHGDVRGVQFTGIVSLVGGETRGAGITGLLNYGAGDVRGLQAAGLLNYAKGAVHGLQYAGLFNYVEKNLNGVQVSSMYNLANADVRYAQLAVIVNAVSGSLTGVQASGGINYVQDDLHGAQMGLLNSVHMFRGAQIAVVNLAGEARGPQLGAVNIARQNDVFALGLVNVAGNGGADWVSFATNVAAFSTGVRTSVRGFYSMFTVGVGDVQDERGDTAFLGWNYGYAFALTPRWSLDTDLGFLHVMPQPSDDPTQNDRLRFALQARALGEVRVGKKATVFGGAGLETMFSEYSTTATTEFEPLVVLGVSLY